MSHLNGFQTNWVEGGRRGWVEGGGVLTLMTLMDCLISSSFLALSLIKCFSSDLFFVRLLCENENWAQDWGGGAVDSAM